MGQNADIFVKLYIGDYLADTVRLTTEQHGAYLLLIFDYWRSGPPPDDDGVLARITGLAPDAWSNARAVLERYFVVEGGVWRHKRIERDIEAANASKKASSDKARKAAKAMWEKRKAAQQSSNTDGTESSKHRSEEAPSNASGDAPSMQQALPEALHVQCPSASASDSTSSLRSEVDSSTPLRASRAGPADPKDPERFEEFWKAYPAERRRGRKQTVANWNRLDPSERAAAHRDLVTLQRASRDSKWVDGFFPEAFRYIANALWTDDWMEASHDQRQRESGRDAGRNLSAGDRVRAAIAADESCGAGMVPAGPNDDGEFLGAHGGSLR